MEFFIKNQVLLKFIIIFTHLGACQSSIVIGQSQELMRMKDVTSVYFMEPDTLIQYGEDGYNFAELRMPKSNSFGKLPVAVIIHGGCWLSAVANADFMQGYATALAQTGYATYNIEYRSADHPSGGWPNTFNDVIQAINSLAKLSIRYSLDLNKVILIGHSAGGHLALWASLFPSHHAQHPSISTLNIPIHGVISLSGIVDLKDYFDPTNQSCGRGVGQLIGGSPEEFAEIYQMTSPVDLYQRDSKLSIVLISGALDPIVTVDHVNLLSDAHPEIQHLIIPQSGHFEMVIPHTEAWGQTIEVLKKMVD